LELGSPRQGLKGRNFERERGGRKAGVTIDKKILGKEGIWFLVLGGTRFE
jgi:hypothetical protein